MARKPYRCAVGLMIKTDEVSEQVWFHNSPERPDFETLIVERHLGQIGSLDLPVSAGLNRGVPIREGFGTHPSLNSRGNPDTVEKICYSQRELVKPQKSLRQWANRKGAYPACAIIFSY